MFLFVDPSTFVSFQSAVQGVHTSGQLHSQILADLGKKNQFVSIQAIVILNNALFLCYYYS